ncbi:Transcriptional repressor nrdR [Candidatus Protochlamydia naegleriophila]|uniref:Transcriptional repressor NrdR n=1 Tax=Candidatus Protochlamydia naegleriophila TaxID=389348 RepID=A0A0U5EU00_9BACT|nr:transcriptional regulator NrdR [Candidatus Protochlamydia naegleriophila]CUI17747.1 Transcriptional repressor nrdR [Candidatus Protochlamydia naegleriophila]
MKCPFCHFEGLKVTDSRDAAEMNAIRRRRECLNCFKRFTTFETIELTVQVKKRDGTYEDFQQQKLLNGLAAACRHTKISHDQVIVLAAHITNELMQAQVQEISTTRLGEMVMKHLQALDPIAYIRFACVYKRFKDLGELEEAIKTIQWKDEDKSLLDLKGLL